jgi:hypothetical protein
MGYGTLTTPVEVPWEYSVSTFEVNTRSGELEQGQYDNVDTGQIFFNMTGEVEDFHAQEKYGLGEILNLKERQQKGVKHMEVFADGTKEVVTKQAYEATQRQERYPVRAKRVFAPTAEAIAVINSASVHTSYVNSITLALNCSSDDDRGVVVAVGNRTPADITGITYNSSALTNEARAVNSGVAGIDLWALAGASSGNNNVVLSNSQYRLHTMYAVCLSGTDQSDIVEATNTGGGWGTSRTVSATSLTDGAWFVSGINTQGTRAMTVDSGETELYQDTNSDSNLGTVGVSSFEKATAGSETLGWSWSSGDNNQMALIVVKPSSGGDPPPDPGASSGQDVWFFN